MGSGYNRREYTWLGLPFASKQTRAKRLGESAAIIRQLLNGETVTFAGEHYTVSEANLGDAPPPVPVLIGGNSSDVLGVAARHADIATLPGYSPGTSESSFAADALARQVELLASERPDGMAQVEVHVLVQYQEITADRNEALARAAAELETTEEAAASSPFVLAGTVEQIAEQVTRQSAELGIDRWTIFGDRPEVDGLAAFAPVADLLGT